MYFNKKKSQKKLVLQKNRFKPKIKFYKKFMFKNFFVKSAFLCVKQCVYLELKYLKILIKFFRKLSKKKKYKIYVNYCCNHAWFKKTKNSRMGKGKGKFVRYFYKSTNVKPLFIFKTVSRIRLKKFLFNLRTMGNYFYIFFN